MIVLAATNRADVLDNSLASGQVGLIGGLALGLPDRKDRLAITESSHLKDKPLDDQMLILTLWPPKRLVRRELTLSNIVNEAAIRAACRNSQED